MSDFIQQTVPAEKAQKSSASPVSADGVYKITLTGEDSPVLVEGKLRIGVEAENIAKLQAPAAKRFAHGYGQGVPGFAGAGIEMEAVGIPVYAKNSKKKIVGSRAIFVMTPTIL